MRLGLSFLVLASAPCIAFAQATPATSPVAKSFVDNAASEGRNLVAAAEAMPADKYTFRPTPAQMTFAQIVVHLAQGNDLFCSHLVGATAPTRTPVDSTAGKAALVQRLRETFDYCGTSLAKLDDSNLSEVLPLFGKRTTTRANMETIATGDWADHYSQSAIYLRLNGVLPPTAQRAATQAGAAKPPARAP